mmetsp:Transcript_60629/g.162274  ORF Transcript_60629/g.162274 Transcript_60629/m.162274 type:complete len:228 (-) Transcript_60629:62-745(-)
MEARRRGGVGGMEAWRHGGGAAAHLHAAQALEGQLPASTPERRRAACRRPWRTEHLALAPLRGGTTVCGCSAWTPTSTAPSGWLFSLAYIVPSNSTLKTPSALRTRRAVLQQASRSDGGKLRTAIFTPVSTFLWASGQQWSANSCMDAAVWFCWNATSKVHDSPGGGAVDGQPSSTADVLVMTCSTDTPAKAFTSTSQVLAACCRRAASAARRQGAPRGQTAMASAG